MTQVSNKALLAWSGGKDAAWALHVLRQSGDIEVVALLSTINRADGRASSQGVPRGVLRAQAAATGLPLLEVELPTACSNEVYEQALGAALELAASRWPGLRTMAFGDLLLEDIRAWRLHCLQRLGWNLLTPLFGSDTAVLARHMIDAGLRAQLCCVDTTQLHAHFCGREFDAGLLADLPAAADPCGENGEFHTCVYDGPMFSRPLQLHRRAQAALDPRFARVDLDLT